MLTSLRVAVRSRPLRLASRQYSSTQIATSWYNPSSWNKASPPPPSQTTTSINTDQMDTNVSLDKIEGDILSVPSSGSDVLSASTEVAKKIDLDALSAEFLTTLPESWYPSDLCTYLIHQTFEYAHCPYWQAIVATTLALRFATLPVHVRTLRNTSRMQHMNPELKALQASMEGKDTSDRKVQEAYRAQMQALFKKYDCNPMKSLMLPLIQMPMFMGMFFGLKALPDKIPDLLENGGPDMSPYLGSIGEFSNLTISDPTYILPICTAVTFLGMIELGADGMNTEQSKMMRQVFRVLGVSSLAFTSWMPQVVFVYWTTNNFFSLGQTIVMKQQPIRDMFGIWKPPKPIPGQENASNDMSKAWDNLKKQISNHNENSEEIKAGTTRKKKEIVDPGFKLHDRPPPPPAERKGGKNKRKKTSKR
ncbi:hypothetical protein TrCOL_g6195 [Triparma columacea]|uniref:Membrane insertase YidC/Oxa/ALB C-terminal domain-containing protein n=1 Tax=Triparma columacea TaxID=722753 RepID=A0A9W7G0A5_9STRA|nr:hypothetical protein TrCOL_g6195 [Triparma columacea]